MKHDNIQMTQSIFDQLVEHAQSELPNECCGYITGTNSELRTVFPMVNVDASPVHFSFDPKEQFKVVKDARKKQESIIVVYHSHPESPARLSNEDLRLLNDPDMVYLIVSLDGDQPELKAYHIINGSIHNVGIELKDASYG